MPGEPKLTVTKSRPVSEAWPMCPLLCDRVRLTLTVRRTWMEAPLLPSREGWAFTAWGYLVSGAGLVRSRVVQATAGWSSSLQTSFSK